MSEVCVTNPTSDLIAVHRRQKRRERILMNSGQRINTILSGPGGNEIRNAPVLEGGDDYSRPFTASHCLNSRNHLESSSANGDLSPSCELLGHSSSLEELGITYTPRPWYCFVQEHRCRACIAIGVILRIMVALSLLGNVVLPWTLYCVIFDFVTAARSKTKYPTRGLLLNGLLYFGIDENFVIRIGFVVERIWNFVRDSLFAAFGFLTAHAVLYFASLLYQMC